MKKLLITLIFLSVLSETIAQKPKVQDDPINRKEFEFLKLRNPKTGKIPSNIRRRELEFVQSNIQATQNSARQDQSNQWTHRGPFNVGGRTRALAVDVTDENTILAGGVSGGLWRTTDQGDTWVKSTASLDIHSITCIAQDTRDGETDTWYYGTGELSGNSASGNGGDDFFLGDGIYKSTNGGVTWTVLSSTVQETPEQFTSNSFQINNEIVVNPTNGDVLIANFFGIQRSQDGGNTFSEVLVNGEQGWSDIKTTTDGVLYATLEGAGVFKSEDNGDSWTDITDPSFPSLNGDRIELAIAPSNENILYIIGEDRSNHTLWKVDDSDGTWTDLTSSIPMLGGDVGDFTSQGGYDLLIEVKPDDENFVVIGGTNLYRSTDGFSSTSNTDWIGGYSPRNDISQYVNHHPDQHAFIFLDGTRALSGNDGGVQITDDITDDSENGSGETVDWIWLNNGYLTTQVYALSTGPGDQVMAGFQDNSTWLTTSTSSTVNWTDQFSGDGAYNAFNSDGTDRYMSAQNAVIYRVTYPDADSQSARSFTQINPSNNYSTSLFITPFYLDPANDDVFYLGGDTDLLVNTQASTANQTDGWKSIALGTSGIVSEFGLTKSDLVYVGTSTGELYSVENPSETSPVVTDLTDSSFPTDGYVASIGVNSFNEDELLVVFSNYEILSIYYSSDAGQSWFEIGGNLEENTDGSGSGPSVRSARIVGNGLEYLVGTSTGLYSTRTIDGANTTWIQEGTSEIGNVVVSHIVAKESGDVVIGTHGIGLLSASIVPTLDIGVEEINQPESQVFTEPSDVSVKLVNRGGESIPSYSVSLSINDALIVTDQVNTPLDSNEEIDHVFPSQFDFTEIGTYEIEVSISADGDLNENNNQIVKTIVSQAAPTDIILSNSSIDESQSLGTVIGTLVSSDEDDDVHTYKLISGDGDEDNDDFGISTNDLVSNEVFDFREQTSFSILIQTEDDDGNVFAKSFSIEINNVLNIDEVEDAGITMYPNPFKSKMNLEMRNDFIGDIDIKIFSLDGKTLIKEKSYYKGGSSTKSMLDLSDLSVGNYLISFEFDDKRITGKLIKE